MTARPRDPIAERVQRSLFARMTASERAARACELAETARELARAGLRARHPGFTPAQVEQALRRVLSGDVPAR